MCSAAALGTALNAAEAYILGETGKAVEAEAVVAVAVAVAVAAPASSTVAEAAAARTHKSSVGPATAEVVV